ncbi:hypothetical protein [Sphingomonas bacterium]|uniref:hypothetical protein n=1 Tax=Sphingomonas bacterium TaxID=1895847 RepID=UPI0015766BFE|nr:hypothetical protein [Sphingomonas bacterium]
MIDNLALGLTHGLMLLAAFLLLKRPDLDREGPVEAKRAPRKRTADGEPPVA